MLERRWDDPGSARRRRGLVPAIGFALLIAALIRVEPARAREGGEDDRARFAGFVEAAPHVIVQRARGSVGTNFDFTSRKSNILTNMTFRLGGGIKGPELSPRWGRPRPVVWAAALIPVNESSTIGTKLLESSTPGFEQVEFSKFSIEYQTSALAALGVEFVVPVFEAEITITPALESLHLVTRYNGQMSLQINGLGFSELHELRTKEEMTQHYLGPALRVGAPTIMVRGVAIDFFLETSLLVDVAGTRQAVRVTGDGDDRGTFTFESGGGVVQVGSGIQIRFP